MSQPPQLADLVPRRNGAYVLILLCGLAIILLLGGLYGVSLRLAALTTDGRVAAFDLDSEGSIASWVSIMLLVLCGQATLVVRRLRAAAGGSRREARAWLAVSLVWITMSLDEGASLHEGFKELMTRVVGSRIFGDGSVYWAVPYFAALSASGMFMLIAARRTPAAVACLMSAGSCYAVAVFMQLELVLAARPMLSTWIEESCEMLGDVMILMTLGLYARSVAAALEESALRDVDSGDATRQGHDRDAPCATRIAPLARAG